MKRITGIVCLALATALTVGALFYFGYPQTDSLGLGVDISIDMPTSADGDTNGKGKATLTAAAVLLDKSGRILKCRIDVADNEVAYTSSGSFVEKTEFKTKYELGYDYNMVNYGASDKEWFEQADAFSSAIVGKTLAQVQTMVAAGGENDIVTAGCTIDVSDFMRALEKAVENAKPTETAEGDTLSLAISTSMTGVNASATQAGKCDLDISFTAATLGADGRVRAMMSDNVQVSFGFDATGATTLTAAPTVNTKRQRGFDYGMSNIGKAEWFEQADAFDTVCVGKTAAEIAALSLGTGYGNADVQSAGCTIAVSALVQNAVKAATLS